MILIPHGAELRYPGRYYDPGHPLPRRAGFFKLPPRFGLAGLNIVHEGSGKFVPPKHTRNKELEYSKFQMSRC